MYYTCMDNIRPPSTHTHTHKHTLNFCVLCVFVGFPVLPLKVPQGVQEEAESSQSEVDQSLQEIPQQRTHSGTYTYAMLTRLQQSKKLMGRFLI